MRTMRQGLVKYNNIPAGLIPEGWLLNIAAESWKINKNDRMGLLLACCQNAIGELSLNAHTTDISFSENHPNPYQRNRFDWWVTELL